ncbi:hypothetical protein BZG36_00954 [Bifiguratus adelaidae]|uniref:Uncharacterized protein n=1 Tax=Bifiguratus adelaidae TaxID=1938954 RepID=A0A261Y5E7_9FUNG|nr:hypothetical protein BZG36_00954 [Bifiguratus adelaidae]
MQRSSNTFLSLPTELLTRIFVEAQTPGLAYACRQLYVLSRHDLLRAHFLYATYGPERALGAEVTLRKIRTPDVIRLLMNLGCDLTVDRHYPISYALDIRDDTLLDDMLQHLQAIGCMDLQELSEVANLRDSLGLLEKLIHIYHADPHAENERMLRDACLYDRVEIVSYLTSQYGCDIHVDNDFPLRMASQAGYTELVRLLLEKGADVHAYHEKALLNSTYKGYYEITVMLLNYSADLSVSHHLPLRQASSHGYTRIVALLLERGADPSAENYKALRDACRNGHIDVVDLLLCHQADPNAGGGLPLACAAESGNEALVLKLLDHGADPCKGGNGPLKVAVRSKNVQVVKILLDAGASLSVDEIMQVTNYRGSDAMRRLLLEHASEHHESDDINLCEE